MASVATCAKEADTGKATGKEEDSSATDAAALAEVIEFSGTDEGTAKAALRAANGDVRRAVNYVFDPSSIQAQAQAKADFMARFQTRLETAFDSYFKEKEPIKVLDTSEYPPIAACVPSNAKMAKMTVSRGRSRDRVKVSPFHDKALEVCTDASVSRSKRSVTPVATRNALKKRLEGERGVITHSFGTSDQEKCLEYEKSVVTHGLETQSPSDQGEHHLCNLKLIEMAVSSCKVLTHVGGTHTGHGTGFLIDGKYIDNSLGYCIMTNHHVYDDTKNLECIARFFDLGQDKVTTEGERVDIPLSRRIVWSERHDYCVAELDPSYDWDKLRQSTNRFGRLLQPVRLSEDTPKLGDTLYVMGHSGDTPNSFHPMKVTGVKDTVFQNGHIEHDMYTHMMVGRIECEKLDNKSGPCKGNSGGPVFNTRGHVVGVYHAADSTSSFVVSVADITEDLNSEAIGLVKFSSGIYNGETWKFVRDNEELINERLVYRTILPEHCKDRFLVKTAAGDSLARESNAGYAVKLRRPTADYCMSKDNGVLFIEKAVVGDRTAETRFRDDTDAAEYTSKKAGTFGEIVSGRVSGRRVAGPKDPT